MHHHTESLVYKAHLPGKLHHLRGEFLRRCGSPSLVLKVIDDGLKQEDKWTSQPGGYEQWNLWYIMWVWKYDFADNKSTKQSTKRCNFGHLCFSWSNLRPSHGQTTVCPGACIWGKKLQVNDHWPIFSSCWIFWGVYSIHRHTPFAGKLQSANH